MDLFDLGESFGSLKEALKKVVCPVMVIGVQTDLLFPVWQQREMATVLQEAGQYLPRRATQSLVRPQHHLSGHRITGQAAQSLVGPHHYWSDLTIIGGPHYPWLGHIIIGQATQPLVQEMQEKIAWEFFKGSANFYVLA